jgi:hypothetical protein
MKSIRVFKQIIKDIIYDHSKPIVNSNFNLLDGKITEGLRLNIVKLGNKNPKKIFYIIKRTHGAGLFSNLSFVLNHLIIADQFGFEPVVDMQNFPTLYNEKKNVLKTKNAWEYYFHNTSRFKLEEVYQSQNVILTDNIYHKNFYRDNFFKSSEIIRVYNKYININKTYHELASHFLNNKLKRKKVLGVFLRGGDFLRSANHHFPATLDQAIKKTKLIIKTEKYDKIFLSTTEKKYFKKFKKTFGSNLITFESFRTDDDIMRIYPRPLHRYKLGKEILVETIILSQLDGFFYSYTNVSQFCMLINLNKKQKRYCIDNGKNHQNVFIAKVLWILKSNLPKLFGGFK